MIIGMWEYWGDGHDLAGTDTVSGVIFFGINGRRLWGSHEGTGLVDWGKWKFGIFNNFLSSRALPTGYCSFVNVLRTYTMHVFVLEDLGSNCWIYIASCS